MAGFRGLLELLGLWPSVPSVPPVVGCADGYVVAAATAANYASLTVSATQYTLLSATVTQTVEGC